MKSIYTWEDYKMFITYPHLIGKMAGMKDLQPIHSKWIHDVQDSTVDFSMMACRASYKSSAIVIIGAIYHMMVSPDDTIGIIRKTYTASAEVVAAIRDISESPAIHELLRFAFFADKDCNIPDDCDWRYVTRKEGRINLSVRTKATPECTVEALGIDSKITGRHYDFCLCDDIVDINDRIYSTTREYTKMVMAEVRANVVKKTGHTAVIGTKWARDDAFSVLEASGVLTPDNIYPWFDKRMSFISEADIKKAREAQTPALFACNYELRYDSGTDCLFKDPRMGKWDYDKVTGVICLVDAAYGGNDANGITIIGHLPHDKFMCVGFRREGHVKDQLDFICQQMKKYKAKSLYMEDNSDKGYTIEQIYANDIMTKEGIWAEGYHENLHKQDKISTILYDNWSNILFANETDNDYLNEITDWSSNTKDHDDCPDSLASALIHGGMVNESWRNLYS